MVQSKLVLHPGDRLFSAAVAALQPHPAFEKLGLASDVARFSSLTKRGDAAFADIVQVTPLLEIIDGYELVKLARSHNRSELFCLRIDVDEEEALLALLQKRQGTAGMEPFIRILLALELEEWLRRKARSNQSRAGQMKGLSNLTEASTIDMRKGLAAAAGVFVGNISKAKECPDVCRTGDPGSHKAWRNHPPQSMVLQQAPPRTEVGIPALSERARHQEDRAELAFGSAADHDST